LERGFSFFSSKLLLFGEYGLIYGAMALSVPFGRFYGNLAFDTDQLHTESTSEIRKFYKQLKEDDFRRKLHFSFDLDRLEADLTKGLYFQSNIPQQYGVGSSGALIAALFAQYAVLPNPEIAPSPELLQADFAMLESYFHGKSSGLDPLISYLNKPLLIDSQKRINKVNFDFSQVGLSFALVDTQTTGATGPLVQHFLELYQNPEFRLAFDRQFLPANNGCIESLLNADRQKFLLYLDQLVSFQLQHLSRMIPGNFHSIVSEAQKNSVYIKLLGSGGGGFLLAIAEQERYLNDWSVMTGIPLTLV
jgi:mevalonate kinase